MSRSALAASVTLLVLAGCGGEGGESTEAPAPTLGGTRPTTTAPARPMDDLERPIAERLGKQVADQGLHLETLDCPEWDGTVPESLVCQGWFDDVPGEVEVRLRRDEGGTVAFDAVLRGGVMSTARLVADLVEKGYDDVDCGPVPAYPTDVGSTIVCAAVLDGRAQHVVATITDDHGGVTISEF